MPTVFKDRIVKIQWVDSCSGLESWRFIEDITPLIPLKVTTVGIVIDENDTSITVAQSITENEKQINGWITIPKVCIEKLEELGEQ